MAEKIFMCHPNTPTYLTLTNKNAKEKHNVRMQIAKVIIQNGGITIMSHNNI